CFTTPPRAVPFQNPQGLAFEVVWTTQATLGEIGPHRAPIPTAPKGWKATRSFHTPFTIKPRAPAPSTAQLSTFSCQNNWGGYTFPASVARATPPRHRPRTPYPLE